MTDDIEFTTIVEDGGQASFHTRTLSRSAIAKCPFTIMVPEHYREDGSCKCNCAQERAYMVEELDYTIEDFIKAGIEV